MFVTIVTEGRDGMHNTMTFSNVEARVFDAAAEAIATGEGNVTIYDANSRLTIDVSRVVRLQSSPG